MTKKSRLRSHSAGMRPSVYLVGGGSMGYGQMFLDEHWRVVHSIDNADLVQFTGGQDVTPKLYGEHIHPKTLNNPLRDKRECLIYNICKELEKPMAGICRGGQFLHVMVGGNLWQLIDHHNDGQHLATDLDTDEEIMVTSTHKQMLRMRSSFPKTNPLPSYELLLIASETMCKERAGYLSGGSHRTISVYNNDDDIEAVLYPKQRVLCFQPHPEYRGVSGWNKKDRQTLTNLYFKYLDKLMERG